MTNNVRFTFRVDDTLKAFTSSVKSKTNSVGGTKYNIYCSKNKASHIFVVYSSQVGPFRVIWGLY